MNYDLLPLSFFFIKKDMMNIIVKITFLSIFLFAFAIAPSIAAQKNLTFQLSSWANYGNLHAGNGFGATAPITLGVHNDAGRAEQLTMIYQHPMRNVNFDISLGNSKNTGVRELIEFCQGAEIENCMSPPQISSRAKSFTQNKTSFWQFDFRRPIFTPSSRRRDSGGALVTNTHLIFGAMSVNETYASYGRTFLEGVGEMMGTDVQIATNHTVWKVIRVGVSARYRPHGTRGRLSYRLKLVTMLTSLSVQINERAYTESFGSGDNINLSGTGGGLASDIGVSYHFADNKAMAIGYRYWQLQAAGAQFLGVIGDKGKLDLTEYELVRHGPTIMLEFSF